MAFPTNANQVQAFAGAMYGVQVGSVTMAQVNNDILAAGSLTSALNSYFTASFGSVATATVAATVAANLGLTGDALAAGTAYITAQLNAAAPGARGAVIANTLNLFAGLASDATFGAAATAWNAKVDVAAAYTGAGNLAIGSVVASTAFTLTASTATPDDMTGTAGDDIFTASLGRLQSADALNGAGGNDVLNARLGSTETPVIASIETLNIEATAAASLEGANITGATNVNVTGGNVLTFLKQDTEAFSLSEKNTGLLTGKAADATTGDTITVSLNSGALGSLSIGTEGTMEYETINLIANGATSVTLDDAGTDDWTDADEKIVVTGSSAIELKIAGAGLGWNATTTSATKATIDATAATGAVTINVGAAGAEFLDVEKMTGIKGFTYSSTGSTSNGTFTLKNAYSGQTLTASSFGDTNDDVTVALKTATGTADTFGIILQNATAGTSVTGDVLTTSGIETVTITSGGTNIAATSTADATTVANTLGAIVTSTTTSKLIVAGDKKLTISSVDDNITNIEVSNATGSDLTVDASGTLTYVGGAGADRLELDTVADLVATGATADTLNGGNGNDTLAFSAVPSAVSAAQLARASNFEVLEFKETNTIGTGGAVQSIRGTTIKTLFLNGAVEVADTKQYTLQAEDGVTLKVGATADASGSTGGAENLVIDVLNAADAGTNNTVNLETTNAASTDYAIAGFTIDNVENLNIKVGGDESASGDVVTISDIDGAQLSSIVISSTNSGAAKVTPIVSDSLTITTAESTLLSNVDATAFTGVLTITGLASKLVATGATIKGGSGANAITGGAGADVITGGKGADTLKGGNSNDNITGGAGNDAIHGEAGADNLTGGAGTDTFYFATAASTKTSMDKISDFGAVAADRDYDVLSTVGNIGALSARTAATLQSAASATDLVTATTETDTGTVLGAITAAGKITFSGTSVANLDTLAEYVDAALIMLASATTITTGYTASSIGFFEYNGNTYVVEETTTNVSATETVTSSVVELTGVTGITGLATSAAAGYITFA
jgi:hypothetical protein